MRRPRRSLTEAAFIFAGGRRAETDNLGFYVIRVDKGSNEFVDNHFITGSAIGSRHETLYGQEYSLFDANGTAQSQYIVESFELNGKRTTTTPVFPSFVASLADITGASSQNLLSRSSAKTGYVSSENLVYSSDVQTAVDSGQQLADPVNQRWVAAQPGAKIGVRQTGMYRVTRAQLAAAGFDVNADVSLWQLYSDGVEQAIIVDPSGNYIDFYGKSIDTIESDTRVYYLVVGPQPGRRMANVGLRPNASTVKAQNYTTSVSVKERTSYLVDLLNGDAENYFGHLVGNFGSSTNVNLTAVDTSAATAEVTVRILGYSAGPHFVNLTSEWSCNRTGYGIRCRCASYPGCVCACLVSYRGF